MADNTYSTDSARPNWETLKANWPNSAHSRFVEAASMTWHVQEMGTTGKPKLLLLHGTGASTHSFGDLLPLLAEHYHCVALDLPGHGFTGKASSEGLSLPGMARSISMLLKELNFAPDYCAGHSAGAAILIWMTLTDKIAPKAIVGLNAALQPIVGNAVFSPLAKLLFINPLTTRLISFQAKHLDLAPKLLKATASNLQPKYVEYYNALVKTRSHIDGALGMMANWDLQPLQDELAKLKTPLFLIAALDDAMVPPTVSKNAAAKAANGKFISFAHGGHLLHEVSPLETAGTIFETLKSIK